MINLNSHINNIRIVSFHYWDFQKILKEKSNFDKSVRRFLNWDKIEPKFATKLDYVGNEIEIQNYLSKSPLALKDEIVMIVDTTIPIIAMKTDYFINNWYEFVCLASHLCLVWSTDRELLIEFNYYDDKLISNFEIKADSRIYDD